MGKYAIADLTVEVELSGIYAERVIPYETDPDRPADITIRCDTKLILEQNPQLGSEDMARYMATGTLFSRKLLDFSGFQLHSSAVMLDGKAYLFSAPPGTGKSTHTAKWCRLFGATCINDDKPVLRYLDGKWYAYGTPWSGKENLSTPIRVELGGVAFLDRGEENTISRLEPGEAVGMLISQCPRFLNQTQMMKQLTLLDQLLRDVPVWLLHCRNDDEAALVSRAAMTGEGQKCKP